MGVEQELCEAVRAGALLAGERPILVMLSGGRDSCCLLDIAQRLRGSNAVSALHVNYGLRAQADEDEQHCRALCERLEIALEVVRAERRAAGTEGVGNLHAWARELRYGAAARIARPAAALIAAGHTASDQAETILYRLAASPGRRALLGMSAREGDLVRPLLGVSREQTGAYCRARAIAWREDESNEDDSFARTRVRNGLLAALRAVHPAAESNVVRTAALLREETELLEALVDDELAGAACISVARLRELPAALARLVVVRLAEQAAGGYVPQAGARVGEIVELAARGGRAELHVGGLVGAVIERGELRMVKLPPRASSSASEPPPED
jgi:tRNA(Ile)-lysidine synthase